MNQEILVITTNKLLNENEIINIYIDIYNNDYENISISMDEYYLNKAIISKVYIQYQIDNNTYFDTIIIYKQNPNILLYINIILIILLIIKTIYMIIIKTNKTY